MATEGYSDGDDGEINSLSAVWGGEVPTVSLRLLIFIGFTFCLLAFNMLYAIKMFYQNEVTKVMETKKKNSCLV